MVGGLVGPPEGGTASDGRRGGHCTLSLALGDDNRCPLGGSVKEVGQEAFPEQVTPIPLTNRANGANGAASGSSGWPLLAD